MMGSASCGRLEPGVAGCMDVGASGRIAESGGKADPPVAAAGWIDDGPGVSEIGPDAGASGSTVESARGAGMASPFEGLSAKLGMAAGAGLGASGRTAESEGSGVAAAPIRNASGEAGRGVTGTIEESCEGGEGLSAAWLGDIERSRTAAMLKGMRGVFMIISPLAIRQFNGFDFN